MFDKLGRREWVRQCDDLLATVPEPRNAAPSGAVPPPLFPPFAPPLAAFQPQGRWIFRITDGAASVMTVDFYPNGTFSAVQQSGPFAPLLQAQGHWMFNPHNHTVQFQGIVNNFLPFMLGVMIQHTHPNGHYGVGSDNCAYFIARA